MSKSVYLASPFFNHQQLQEAKTIETLLNQNSTVASVFSPRKVSNPFKQGTEKWSKRCYQDDINGIKNSDVIVAVLDFSGSHVDSGTAFEIGYASAIGKPIIAIHLTKGLTNLMITNSIRAYLTNYQQLKNYNFNNLPKISYHGSLT